MIPEAAVTPESLEPTRLLEPRTARLQEAFVPRIYCLVLKVLTSSMVVAVFRGSLQHEFDEVADDTPSTVDSTRPSSTVLPNPPLRLSSAA